MKKIRIGIFGARRGSGLAKDFMLLNCEIAAICDSRESALEAALEELGGDIPTFRDFDEFIKVDMDAVVLANYFHEHTPYAIKCFERGIHVYSECTSNGTMAEGVELVRAFEKSKSIYMLAENYPQMVFNREMKRLCDGGTLGKIIYAEGEYNHPGDPNNTEFKKNYVYFGKHWRNYLPRTYYITHSLAPLMWATGATPKRVSAFASYAPNENDTDIVSSYVGDRAAIVTMQNDDGSVFRVTGCAAFGGHHNAYRFCGTEGSVENLRDNSDRILLHYNDWTKPEGAEEISIYTAPENDKDAELIKTSGHGGGDYLAARLFVECLREGKQPPHPFDIYSATVMSSVGILSHRSMLEGGTPYSIPDFRREEDRLAYENDRITPFYSDDGTTPDIPCCSHTDHTPTKKQLENYQSFLENM